MDLDPTKSHPLQNWPRPLSFVLSGGGAYGATQVGMLRALLEVGIVPDIVVGSSVGAMNGVILAAEPDDASDRLAEVWRSMGRARIFGPRMKVARAFSAARHGLRKQSQGLCSPDRLRSLIDAHAPDGTLEDLPTTTVVVVTDALAGRPKLLTHGPIGPALQATSAIPGVFPPVKIGGGYYIDGGVSANVPIRQAVAAGAKSVVVLDANPATMPGTLPHSLVGSVRHASMIMLRNQRADATEDLVGKHPILHVPQVTPTAQDSFDFGNSEALIEAGYTSTRDFVSRLPTLTDTNRLRPRTDGDHQEQSPSQPPPPGPGDAHSMPASSASPPSPSALKL